MEIIDKYLDALIEREISGRTPKELRLNGFRWPEYEREMGERYEAFRIDLLAGTSVADFVAIKRKVDEAKRQEAGFRLLVGKTDTKSPIFRPLQSLYAAYKRQVEKTAELVESVNIMKLSQSAPVPQQVPMPEAIITETQPKSPEESVSAPIPTPTADKEQRRSFNDAGTSHPGEYWGYKEMEKGEGIAHSTAWNIVKNPYYAPAIRFVGRNLRVDIAKLHALQQKAAAERPLPIGANPRRGKN